MVLFQGSAASLHNFGKLLLFFGSDFRFLRITDRLLFYFHFINEGVGSLINIIMFIITIEIRVGRNHRRVMG